MPYFEGKIMKKTDDGDQPLPVLNINLGTDSLAQRGLTGGGIGPIKAFAKIQQDQEVIEVLLEPSNEDASNEPANIKSNQELNDDETTD